MKATTPRNPRYIPYVVPLTFVNSNKRANAEAGPSNMTSANMSPTNPSGGLSEATASAERPYSTTEENAAPVSNFYCSHILRVDE